MVVFGDDGEKFGTWPETKKHVYENGWLERFFDALVAEPEWIKVTTLAEADRQRATLGKIYLPDCQLSRDDRMGFAGRSAGRVRAGRATKWSTTRAGRC